MQKAVLRMVFICMAFGVTTAFAESMRVEDGHSSHDFGVGGWTQNYATKSVGSGVSGISRGDRGDGNNFTQGVGDEHVRVLGPLLRDSECIFVSKGPPGGASWGPGCK
jgi:hypothetical protein